MYLSVKIDILGVALSSVLALVLVCTTGTQTPEKTSAKSKVTIATFFLYDMIYILAPDMVEKS